jgi:predicted phosphodiesterase
MRKKIIPSYIMDIFQKNPRIGRKQLAEEAEIPVGEARFFCRVYKEMTSKIKFKGKGVALFDIHYPEHDEAALEVTFEFLKDFKPDWLILGGDQMTLDAISSFNRRKIKLRENKRLKKEYDGFQRDVLDRLEEILPAKCKKYFIIGNHEYRIDRLKEYNPTYEGLIEVENNLNLKNWIIIPFNNVFNIGDMHFTHGWYYNLHYTKKTVLEAQKMIFVGHVHIPQTHTAVSPAYALPKQCVGVGCLCNRNPEYMEDKPNAWVHQFLFWYMFDDGTFTYFQPTIINGRCIINGKVYDGNEKVQRLWFGDKESENGKTEGKMCGMCKNCTKDTD